MNPIIQFECCTKKEKWNGIVTKTRCHNSYFEIMIESRSSIMVVLGRTSRGGFACIPDFSAGCHLSELSDIFWNTEKLTKILGRVDGTTVAQALYAFSSSLSGGLL